MHSLAAAAAPQDVWSHGGQQHSIAWSGEEMKSHQSQLPAEAIVGAAYPSETMVCIRHS